MSTFTPSLSSILALFFISSATSHADHGQDFFLLHEAKSYTRGQGNLQTTFSFKEEAEGDEWGASTGLSLGLFPRAALLLRGDFAGEDTLDFSAVETGLQLDLTPPQLKAPVRFGLSLAWQYAAEGGAHHSEESSHNETEEGEAGHSHADSGGHSHTDTEAEESPQEENHGHGSSIHNHDENVFTTRLTFEADLTPRTLFGANLITVFPEDSAVAWGYAVGLRHRFIPTAAVGVEASGDFRSDGYHEVLTAVYWQPIHHLILKAGVGTGLTEESPDLSLRLGLVYAF